MFLYALWKGRDEISKMAKLENIKDVTRTSCWTVALQAHFLCFCNI